MTNAAYGTETPRIKVLPPEEARRIAAGEVIDRPAAMVREFLDNAIDAGASNIEVRIEEGGCKKVEVIDDGEGLCREDLEMCTLAHATSKIRGLDDLERLRTLGFRGEALAAAAAVARLEIVCSTDGREAWRLETGPGDGHPQMEQTRRTKGATVRALNLFENIPARKRFLKREGSEAGLCRQAFLDKALVFNALNFRFVQDGKLKDFFPAVPTKKERFTAVYFQSGEENFLHEIEAKGAGFSATVVIGGPELYRNDRRLLFVFANGRRVQDYALMQAVEYGVQGWFPNGTHPEGALFIDIDPALADFNIHPAKREARFRDPGAIHHTVTGCLRSFFHTKTLHEVSQRKAEENSEYADSGMYAAADRVPVFTPAYFGVPSFDVNRFRETPTFDANQIKEERSFELLQIREAPPVSTEARYVGRLFGLFILIEWGQRLYIIDQHAAHERILYNRFLSQPIPRQELLAPIPFCAESEEEDRFLEAKRGELGKLGVEIEKDEDGWCIEALPPDWRLSDAATVKGILELRTAGENMAERWAATVCCREALKDGEYPDDETAFELGREALALPDPRCPHGRPIWTEISRDALFKAVRRV
jgi:DNA mismatch repair protein MutL